MDAIIPTETTQISTLEADPHLAALLTWLEGKPENTQRAYKTALHDFLGFTDKHPRDVTPLDVARWKEHLKSRCADSTVAQRLSAVSSYYGYLQRPLANGQPLNTVNPVDGVERGDLEISPYERAKKLAAQDFRRILEAIDADTVIGARDRAIFLFYVLCARRQSEVARLRGRDLRVDAGKVVYRVRLKRGRVKWKELPPPVWEAIKHYLALAGRKLSDESPLFVATTDAGKYLREYHGAPEPEDNGPLTGAAISQALKRYADHAELDPASLSLHSLRHLGAELFQEVSGDLRQTQLFLDHAHLNTTQIYLAQLTGEDHRHWQGMANRLGI